MLILRNLSYIMEGQNQQQEIDGKNDQLQMQDKDDPKDNEPMTSAIETVNELRDISSQITDVPKQPDQQAQKAEEIQGDKKDQSLQIQDQQNQPQKSISQSVAQQLETQQVQNSERTVQSKRQSLDSDKVSEPIEDDLNQQTALTNHQQSTDKIEQKAEEQAGESQKKQSSPQKSPNGQADEQSNMFMETVSNKTASQASYGNNYILFRNKYIFITIGPDYLCFIPTFIFFCIISFLLITFINHNVESVIVKIITSIVCIGECLSYLILALSDPGIASPISSSQKILIKTSFCRKCRFDVPKNSYHCNYCDVCILGYDHHCPWTSKCVGKRNLIKFYFFLFMTPIYIVYCAFAFGFTVQSSDKLHQNLRKVMPQKI